MPTLEEIAQYRPGVLSRLTNVLTGGLAGYVTGTTQRGEEAARARQMLSQEELMDREMRRRAERMRFENALQGAAETGLADQLGPNAKPDIETLQRMVAQKAQENRVAAAKGALYGAGGQTVEPSPEASNPFFQQAALNAQAQIAQQKQIRSFDDAKELAVAKAGLEQQGIDTSNMPQSDILAKARTVIPAATATAQSAAYSSAMVKPRADQAKAYLERAEKQGWYKPTTPIGELSDYDLIAEAEQAKQSFTANAKQRIESSTIDAFNQAFAENPNDKKKLQMLFGQLPKSAQNDANYRIAADMLLTPSPSESKDIASEIEGFKKSVKLGKTIQQLVGNRNLQDVSAELFNSPISSIRSVSRKLFGQQSEQARQIDDIVQQFANLNAGTSNKLFGASLTANELEKIKTMFGDPSQANFLPRALSFIDEKFANEPFAAQRARAVRIIQPIVNEHQKALNEWNTLKSQMPFFGGQIGFGYGTQQQSGPGVTNRIRIDARGNRIQ